MPSSGIGPRAHRRPPRAVGRLSERVFERAKNRYGALALCAGGGFLVAMSLPPWGWWPLAFVGIAVFEVALGPTPAAGRRLACGMVFGGTWLAMGMGWMWQLTAPGYLAASLIFAAFHGIAALAAPTGRWRVIGRPAAHTLVEATRLSFPAGGVPLATLGIAEASSPIAYVVRIGGVILLTWIVFQLGFALGALAERSARTNADAALAAIVVAVVLLVAVFAPTGAGTGRFVEVVGVQGGGEQGTSALEVASSLVTQRHLEATATIEPDPQIDLVLWPENVIDVDTFPGSDELAAVAAQAARLGVPISVGVTEDVDSASGRVTNAQVVVPPEGEITSRYDKVRRVPFGEYVPMRGLLEALGAPIEQVRTNAVAGTGPAVLDLPNGDRFAVVISWEVFFGGRAREGVKEGGQAILNPTNGSSYTGTILQTQQVASSRLRALETGRWLVQVSPTGFSEFVTPEGDVQQRTAVSERAVIRQTIELRTGRTWYVTLGERPWIAAVAAVLAASWLIPILRTAGRHG